MPGGKSRYRLHTGSHIPVQAAQTPMAALRFQQRCPHSPLPQVGERGVAQLVQCPPRSVVEQRPRLLIRQTAPTGVRTHVWESGRLVGSAVGDEQRAPLAASQIAG